MNAKNALHSHTNNYKRKFFFTRFVLFTSLPSYIVAEVFFACVYYGIVQCMQWIYLFLASIGTTNNLEANMQIFSPINIVVFLIGLGFVSLVACLEILTIIAITAYDYYRNDHIPLKTLMRFSYERLQSFLHLRSTPFLLFVFLFPKFHIGPSGLFALDIPPFILDELAKTPIYVVLFVLLFAFIGYIIYRSIFVLHYLFFERATIKRAFRMSFCLTKKLGYKKTLWIFCRTIFSVVLLVLPIVAIVVALFRFIE